MKIKLTILLLFSAITASAQNRFPPINWYGGDPTGHACTINSPLLQSQTTGYLYGCNLTTLVYQQVTNIPSVSGCAVAGTSKQLVTNSGIGGCASSPATADSSGNVNATSLGLSTPLPTGSGGTGAATAAGAAANIVNNNPITPSSTTSLIYDKGGAVFNVKSYGATGNGSTDDTTAIKAAVTALTTAGEGNLYFPQGTYKVSSTVTISVPVTISGAGNGSNDFSQAISEIACSSGSTDCIDTTGEYVNIHDLLILNTSGTPTAGYAFNFCSSGGGGGSYLPPKFEIDHVVFGFSYSAVNSCNAEVLQVSHSDFLGIYYDGLHLASTTFNNGDCAIEGNNFTASANQGFAAIDFEGATNCRISGNKDVLGFPAPTGNFDYAVYSYATHPAQGLIINNNDFENNYIMAFYLPVCSNCLIEGNVLVQNNTVGPAIHILGSGVQQINFPLNIFINATGSTIAEAILFDNNPSNSTVMPQSADPAFSGGGYTVVQSGMTTATSGNADLSPLSLFQLPNLTLNAASGSAGTLTTNEVTSPTSYPLVLNSASGQNIRFEEAATAFIYAQSNAFYPAVDDAVENGDPSAAWTQTNSYIYKNHNGIVIPTGAAGYTGSSTGYLSLVPGTEAFGIATLSSGTVTVSNAAACTPSATCVYKLARCIANGSTAVGVPSVGTVSVGTSFVITALSSTNTTVTGDTSEVCWQIN